MPRRGVPLLVSVLTCALLAGSVYAAERVGLPAPAGGAAGRFVPADGTAAYARVERPGQPPVTQVVESARGTGLTLISGLTFVFGALMLQSLGDAGAQTRAWRTTATTVTERLDRSAQPAALLYRVDGAVELLGDNTPGRGRAFRPALVELPADVAPGATWSGTGNILTGVLAQTTLGYRSTFRAAAAASDCLLVTGEVAYADAAGRPRETEQHRKRWCPGRGLVEQRVTAGAAVTSTTPAEPPPPPDRATTGPPVRWADPAGWQVRSFEASTVDPNFGDYPQPAGSPTLVPPVVSAAGDVFRVVQQTGDVVGFTPLGSDAWRSAARMHPGGSVLSLAAFGEVLVVTTSRRQAVGYTADGIRLWTLGLAEVADAPAVRASDTEVVIGDLGGGLRRVDLRTGAVRWSRAVGFDVAVPPAVGADRVIVTDRGGRQTAYALGTGDELWRTERTAEATVFAGPVLVAVERDALEAVDPADGSVRWRRVADGNFNRLVVAGDRAVVATDTATWVVAPDGTELARLPPYVDLTVTADHIVGWTRTRGEVWTVDGRRLGEWTPPPLFTEIIPGLAAVRSGVLVGYGTWLIDVWGAS